MLELISVAVMLLAGLALWWSYREEQRVDEAIERLHKRLDDLARQRDGER